MSGRDWFRKETWSAGDAADFERRLGRARGQRTQYLKLQAWHLANTKKPGLANPAIELAKRYLQEEPAGIFEAQAHLIIAEASVTLGNTGGALSAYRKAVEVESQKHRAGGHAYLEYAWFVATNDLIDEFEKERCARLCRRHGGCSTSMRAVRGAPIGSAAASSVTLCRVEGNRLARIAGACRSSSLVENGHP